MRKAEVDGFFWDEPHYALPKSYASITGGAGDDWGCRCPECMKKFEDYYGYEMPKIMNDDVKAGPLSGIGSFAIAHLLEIAAMKACLKKGILLPVWANANTPEGAARKLQADDLLEASIQKELEDCNYLLLQNELSLEVLEAAVEMAGKRNIPVILNPAPAENIPTELLRKCKIVTPNYGEAKMLAQFM